jgi:hypothetical protein
MKEIIEMGFASAMLSTRHGHDYFTHSVLAYQQTEYLKQGSKRLGKVFLCDLVHTQGCLACHHHSNWTC